MRATAIALMILVASVATAAGGEQRLDDAGIRAALTDRTAVYEGGVIHQYFDRSGRTPYWDGKRLTQGSWQALGNKYCSVWPPSSGVSCYEVYRTDDGQIVWLGSRNDRYVATMVDGNRMPAQ